MESEERGSERAAEEAEQQAEQLEDRSQRLEQEIEETRRDWESKKDDAAVPGATEDEEPNAGEDDAS